MVNLNEQHVYKEDNVIDWRKKYDEYAKVTWDPEKQPTGVSRLGDSYHPLEAYFKFNNYNESKDRYTYYNYIFWGAALGAMGSMVSNHLTKRSSFAAFPVTIAAAVAAGGFSHLVYKMLKKRSVDRDIVCTHYMLLHEDRFPQIRKFKL